MSNTIKLKPSARVSGGTPNGVPDYRPFNKLPEAEQRAQLKTLLKKTIRPALYQVRVEDVNKGDIAVGPKCSERVATAFAYAISTFIKSGKETVWSNPRVVLTL